MITIKKILCMALIFVSVMLLVPLTAMKSNSGAVTAGSKVDNIPKAEKAATDTFRIYDSQTEKITEMKAEDYIFGVVAAEIPASYESEALKAQAVAAYTFACYRRAQNSEKDYDLTTDYTTDQSYISKETAKERWGSNADAYMEKIEDAVSSVSGYMITYDGSPALAVYHAVSSGKTESAKNVWGKDYAYLQPVSSIGDKLSPDYISTLEISAEDLANKLSEEITVTGDASDYFGKCTRTDSGTVSEIAVCGQTLKGARIRSLLDLRSSAFEISYKDGIFTFTVYGYGHGVGMSQYGANYMAKQGADYKQILTAYYTDCKIKKVS